MTFEEFFLKKKIDLALLEKGKPELFIEFKSHYEQMSEKSFDHSKKYWFNALRQDFKLTDEKEIALKEAFKPQDVTPFALTTTDFKTVTEDNLEKEQTEKAETEINTTEVAKAKPAGFKPRFKASNLAESSKHKAESETLKAEGEKLKAESKKIEEEDKEVPITKPAGFKPRFKATNLAESEKPKAKSEILKAGEETETVNKEVSISKPSGFKPRFKAGVTKPVEKTNQEETEPTQQKEEQILEEDKPTNAKPLGFKPRFKAGVTKPVEQAEKMETESTKENILQEDEPKITIPKS
jgi:hypothetical protein